MESLEPTIGLEVHAELKTHTKMFCDCINDPHEHHPNINICPVCVGHPGTLPTINKEAVKHVLRVGLALGGKIFPKIISKFDRKNYFYPDLPKGYQISQYDQPLVEEGNLQGIKIRRIHLEEDAGQLTHGKNESLVDYNRAGVPLMELVTEPDIKSASQAMAFAKELRLILRYLGASDADMEKGHLRLEANVSLTKVIKKPDQPEERHWGTKVEIKNINSFKALGDAINFEIDRQGKLLKANRKVLHETRGWNDVKKATVLQRSKEEAQDYRYFPEPDLPPFDVSAFNIKLLTAEVPEIPEQKRRRFIKEYKLDERQVDVLVQDLPLADYFEQAASELPDLRLTSLLYNYYTSDLWGMIKKEGLSIKESGVSPSHLAHLIELIDAGRITSRIAKDLLQEMRQTGLDPHEILENQKWSQISDDNSLESVAKKVIEDQPEAVAQFHKGKTNSIQFLIGMAMSELGGKADPKRLKTIIENLINQ